MRPARRRRVIEDAAEALGAGIAGAARRPADRDHRALGCFSFNGNKIITTGGGGMIVTDDEALAAPREHLTTQAQAPRAVAYVHDEVGYNYRLTNLAAALGLAQLEDPARALLAARRANAARYDTAIAGMPGLLPAARAPWADLRPFWLYHGLSSIRTRTSQTRGRVRSIALANRASRHNKFGPRSHLRPSSPCGLDHHRWRRRRVGIFEHAVQPSIRRRTWMTHGVPV